MTANDTLPAYTCKCGADTAVYFQPSKTGLTLFKGERGDFAATCFNAECDLYSVTLEPERLASLSADEIAEYRAMNEERKALAPINRQKDVLRFAFRRATQNAYGASLTPISMSDHYGVTPEELTALESAGYLLRIGSLFPAYFITPKACEFIQKPFAELGKTLSSHYQQDVVTAMLRAGFELDGIVSADQLKKCQWYIDQMDARASR
jgi:hypothetical protein